MYLSNSKYSKYGYSPRESNNLYPSLNDRTTFAPQLDTNSYHKSAIYNDVPLHNLTAEENKYLNSRPTSYQPRNKYGTEPTRSTNFDFQTTRRPVSPVKPRNKYLASPIKSVRKSPRTPVVPRNIYKVLDSTPKGGNSVNQSNEGGYFNKFRDFLSSHFSNVEDQDQARVLKRSARDMFGIKPTEKYVKRPRKVTFETTDPVPERALYRLRYDVENDILDETVQENKALASELERYKLLQSEKELLELRHAISDERKKNERLISKHNQDLQTVESEYKQKLRVLNRMIGSLEDEKKNENKQKSRIELDFQSLKAREQEMEQYMDKLKQDYESRSSKLAEKERALSDLQRDMDTKTRELRRKENDLDAAQQELEYVKGELKEREREIKSGEIKAEIERRLTIIKDLYAQQTLSLSQESLQIKMSAERNEEEYNRLHKRARFSLPPLKPLSLKDTRVYDKIAKIIEDELEYMADREVKPRESLENTRLKQGEDVFQTLKEYLNTSKIKSETKIKQVNEAVISLGARIDSASAHGLYQKKQKALDKLKIINNLLTKISLVFELQEDFKVLLAYTNEGINLKKVYKEIKTKLDEKYI